MILGLFVDPPSCCCCWSESREDSGFGILRIVDGLEDAGADAWCCCPCWGMDVGCCLDVAVIGRAGMGPRWDRAIHCNTLSGKKTKQNVAG